MNQDETSIDCGGPNCHACGGPLQLLIIEVIYQRTLKTALSVEYLVLELVIAIGYSEIILT